MADKKPNIRGTLTARQTSLFVSGTQFSSGRGEAANPFREMTIGQSMKTGRHASVKGSVKWFSDPRQMQLRNQFNGTGAFNKNVYSTHYGYKSLLTTNKMTRQKWAAFKGAGVMTLSPNELNQHFSMIAHLLPVVTERWKMVLIKRAEAVFRESFTLKRFNSAGTKKWQANTTWTVHKRQHKGTWPGFGGLLQEYGTMSEKSWKITSQGTSVTLTNTAGYAGIHNNPRIGIDYYGITKVPVKYTRQFMGHSTEIDEFIVEYERRYMFDTLFRTPV